MPARKKQHVTGHRTHATYYAIGPHRGFSWRFSARATVAKQFPIRVPPVDVSTTATLVIPIVPFDQIPVYVGDSSKASQLTRASGPLQRARKHMGKTQST